MLLNKLFFCCIMCACTYPARPVTSDTTQDKNKVASIVNEIELPAGYKPAIMATNSFDNWLNNVPLRASNTVYLYNGEPKKNQAVQYAVLDIDCGKENLQQCADAVMRMRAEYLFSQKRYEEIVFYDNNSTPYAWKGSGSRPEFEKYLRRVFSMCGTASLQKQLHPVTDINKILAGDVFIKGGFPGHAMIVMKVVQASNGKKKYMLAQSYMPAQDIHIVKNPAGFDTPWFTVDNSELIETPEWTFTPGQLYGW